MIINIRGCNGSGKSTIVHNIHSLYGKEAVYYKGKRPRAYRTRIPWLTRPLFTIGSYESACGGCDAITPYTDIWPLVVKHAEEGHVIFEGMSVSSSYGTIGKASEVYGDDFVFVFINPPLSVCLDRVKARRAARGDERPFNPDNVVEKFKDVARSLPKIRDIYKRRVIILPYQKPLPMVLGVLRNAEDKTNELLRVRTGAVENQRS